MRIFVEKLQADSGITLVNSNDEPELRLFIHAQHLPELIKKAKEAWKNSQGYARKDAPSGDNLCWATIEIMGSRFPCNRPKRDCAHSKDGRNQDLTEENWQDLGFPGEVGLRDQAYQPQVAGDEPEIEQPYPENDAQDPPDEPQTVQEWPRTAVATEVEAEEGED